MTENLSRIEVCQNRNGGIARSLLVRGPLVLKENVVYTTEELIMIGGPDVNKLKTFFVDFGIRSIAMDRDRRIAVAMVDSTGGYQNNRLRLTRANISPLLDPRAEELKLPHAKPEVVLDQGMTLRISHNTRADITKSMLIFAR